MPGMPTVGAGASGGFAPTSLPSLQFWYDESSWAALADGAAATTWTDLSGNGRDATQGTAGFKPLVRDGANGVNGHKCIRFDGVDDLMATAAWTNPTQITVFSVSRLTDATQATGHLFCHAAAATWVAPFGRYAIRNVNFNHYEAWVQDAAGGAGNYTEFGVPDGNAHVLTWHLLAGSNMHFRMDGTDLGNTSNTATLTQTNFPLYLGGHQGTLSAADWYKGDLCELIACVAPSTKQITDTEAFLKSKWGTP